MTVNIVPARPSSGGGGAGGGGSGGVNVGTDVTYTRDGDFERASLLNVNHDAPRGDQLQLNEKAKPLPFVAIPGTNRGTMIRININTGQIVGEYWSSPAGRSRTPSRTTIDQLKGVTVHGNFEGQNVLLEAERIAKHLDAWKPQLDNATLRLLNYQRLQIRIMLYDLSGWEIGRPRGTHPALHLNEHAPRYYAEAAAATV